MLDDSQVVDPLVGTMIGSYRVERVVGRGGMGAVYELLHPTIHKRMALKLLHPEYSHRAEIVSRFFDEARAVNLIGHPNIVDILDFSHLPDGRPYITMEYLAGQSLEAYLERNAPLPSRDVHVILRQMCSALEAAHHKGIVHRDLKPENVFLVSRPDNPLYVKILDFGIAKLRDDLRGGQQSTQTGVVLGTPTYMSPEQAAGNSQASDHRTDIYSLGVIVFQMLTGKPPFQGQTFAELLVKHLNEPPPELRGIRRDLSDRWSELVNKALAKEKDARFASMNELYEAAASADAATSSHHQTRTGRPPRGRLGPLVVATALLLIAAAALGALYIFKKGDRASKPTLAATALDAATNASSVPVAAVSPRDASVPTVDASATFDAAAVANTAETKRDESGEGELSITADPWAQVYIDGKHVGQTPFLDKLSAGRHRIKLKNEATGQSTTHTVRIRKGKLKRIIEKW